MIEQFARASAEDLRAGTTSDVEAGLADLHVRQEGRQRRIRVGAVAAVVLAVGLGWTGGAALTHKNDRAGSPAHPAPSQSYSRYPCSASRVTCLGDRTYGFDLVRPVEWQLPPGFRLAIDLGVSPLEVRGVRSGGAHGAVGTGGDVGVRVLERVRASSPNGSRPAPGVADDPRAFVNWVASRPFLHAGPVVRTELDGNPAWQVQERLADGAGPGRKLCGGYPCHLLTHQPDTSTAGINQEIDAKLTALRLPGAGTTVVWSWSFTGNTSDLASMDQAVAGLHWPDQRR